MAKTRIIYDDGWEKQAERTGKTSTGRPYSAKIHNTPDRGKTSEVTTQKKNRAISRVTNTDEYGKFEGKATTVSKKGKTPSGNPYTISKKYEHEGPKKYLAQTKVEVGGRKKIVSSNNKKAKK